MEAAPRPCRRRPSIAPPAGWRALPRTPLGPRRGANPMGPLFCFSASADRECRDGLPATPPTGSASRSARCSTNSRTAPLLNRWASACSVALVRSVASSRGGRLRDEHGGCGRRLGETHRWKHRQGGPGRPHWRRFDGPLRSTTTTHFGHHFLNQPAARSSNSSAGSSVQALLPPVASAPPQNATVQLIPWRFRQGRAVGRGGAPGLGRTERDATSQSTRRGRVAARARPRLPAHRGRPTSRAATGEAHRLHPG